MRLRVLVVDDDDAVRSSIVRMLVAHGHNAIGATDGTQAFSLALEHSPHVIIMDVHMPDPNGVAVARKIKEHASLAAIPLLALSSAPGDVAGLGFFRQVLSKPCTSADLLVAVLHAAHPEN